MESSRNMRVIVYYNMKDNVLGTGNLNRIEVDIPVNTAICNLADACKAHVAAAAARHNNVRYTHSIEYFEVRPEVRQASL